ncbi:undecaprenyldiphospho-muramoylpentapeptide beta-N-acetylglucosaminyltransferase [Arenicella xantha]|nr:undecaprenyldiphospho-muramoylpentapeptide beta-N-acetylglucosaminyltransferase [Arenicella xantha]
MRAPRLLVMAGGTGGHVYPALAVANTLRETGVDVTWLGTRLGLEAKVIPENAIPIEWISVEGLRGRRTLSLVLAPFKLLRAMWQSMRVIRRVEPDCILGMGGFVSGPGGIVARLMRKPLVVHEQNAVAGLTNKYLAKVASRVITGFPNVAGLPAGALWVGNPVRKEIERATIETRSDAEPLRVLIIGGSQGAHTFNTKLPEVFTKLDGAVVEIWHQTGRDQGDAVEKRYREFGVHVKVTEFIDDMAAAYQWSDLLICRAGAMTIAECCAAGRPALLIPYPFSAGDHQRKNAEAMVAVGGAKVLDNQQVEQAIMVSELNSMLADKAQLHAMGERARKLHKPNALNDVADVCREYLNA